MQLFRKETIIWTYFATVKPARKLADTKPFLAGRVLLVQQSSKREISGPT